MDVSETRLPLLCVVGPTATGKSALAVRLAQRFDGEIVSADSMQIYRGAPIATAVPPTSERGGVPHHLLEFLEPDAAFTVADYVAHAHRILAEIAARNRLPLLVGGTGLYVNSVVDYIQFPPAPDGAPDDLSELSAEDLLERLASVDPEAAADLHPNNRRRILRALELYAATGQTRRERNAQSRALPSPYDPLLIGFGFCDRELLWRRIDRRVDEMLANGLVDEARRMAGRAGQGMAQAIGHKELLPYLRGEQPLEACVDRLKRETRRFAKRQMTWFSRDERIRWIWLDEQPDPFSAAVEMIEHKKGWRLP